MQSILLVWWLPEVDFFEVVTQGSCHVSSRTWSYQGQHSRGRDITKSSHPLTNASTLKDFSPGVAHVTATHSPLTSNYQGADALPVCPQRSEDQIWRSTASLHHSDLGQVTSLCLCDRGVNLGDVRTILASSHSLWLSVFDFFLLWGLCFLLHCRHYFIVIVRLSGIFMLVKGRCCDA